MSKNEKKKFVVTVQEIYSKTVIVEADDQESAYDLTWDLLNTDTLALNTGEDYSDSIVDVSREADTLDLSMFGRPFSQADLGEESEDNVQKEGREEREEEFMMQGL